MPALILARVRSATLLTASALVATAAASDDARACSCSLTPAIGAPVLPPDGAVDVPTNARVFVGGELTHVDETGRVVDVPRPVALRAGDVDVATTTALLTSRAGAVVTVVAPTERLAAGARFDVVVDGAVVASFTTGADGDDSPPAVPVVERATATSTMNDVPFVASSSCGDGSHAQFTLRSEGVLDLLDNQGGDEVDTETLAGEATHVGPAGAAWIGAGACAGNWDGARPLATTQVRFASIDQAGNFSGWSTPRDVVLPVAGCTCAATGTTSSTSTGAAATIALAVLLRRRRRG